MIQVRVSAQYAEAIYRVGGLPMVVPTYAGDGPEYVSGRGWPGSRPKSLAKVRKVADSIVMAVSGLTLTGGGDVLLTEEPGAPRDRAMDRDRDFWEEALFLAAIKRKKPVLGICRGLQLMNVALGGSLWDDVPSQIPEAGPHQQRAPRDAISHLVRLDPESRLAKVYGRDEIQVNSGHHQAVRELGQGLKIVGRGPDGVVEAVESQGSSWLVGVQWHPEGLIGLGPERLNLFAALVGEAKLAGLGSKKA
ncbi:MAG: gamma-glutamyl-gamma-aminobutyrate hydrolase family protein [Deltaproteobacteria bacterium]|nr:gamma-glutamyl-gamma-aminobutyrate hydrolase family protein [Deltaproteobacteria bacterium]